MEKGLEDVLDDALKGPGVYGCLFGDHQGLCLGAKGKASKESSGIIVAIAEQAAKLEPQNTLPVVFLETDNQVCIIQRNGTITGAICKNLQAY